MSTSLPDSATASRPWWRDYIPAALAVNERERLRAAAGALVGLLLTGLVCRAALPAASTLPWLVAPLGASAVLVFAVPASPLAQPWSVLGGNTLSALVGIGCVLLFGTAPWVAALAVGLAIAVMFRLRCLHPPGGASALLMVLVGVHELSFAFFPVLINSLLLAAAGVAYNRATGRRYPHGQQPAAAAAPDASTSRFVRADLDAALARYNQVLDVSRDDLEGLLEAAEAEGHRRRLNDTCAADIMSRQPITVQFGTPLGEAWTLMRQHRIKALPVIDRARRLVGIVTLADFMRSADLDRHAGWTGRLRALLRPTQTMHSDKAETVGQIMTRQVRVCSAGRTLGELLPLFAADKHHHIPVIDDEQRLVGIITQSDLVAALGRGV